MSSPAPPSVLPEAETDEDVVRVADFQAVNGLPRDGVTVATTAAPASAIGAAAKTGLQVRKKVGIVFFSGNGTLRKEAALWLAKTCYKLGRDPEFNARYELLPPFEVQDTPVDMSRNRAAQIALDNGIDYLLMLDDDMQPDYLVGDDAGAKPFVPTALEFLSNLPGGQPGVIAAPYCGPPPDEYVYVFHWRWGETTDNTFRGKLEMVPREQASLMRGVQQAAALPTGVMMIDTRVFRLLPEPWFYYEYRTARRTHKASTEDVTFSRDLAMIRVPVYCAWDCWAVHVKTKFVGRPQYQTVDIVNDRIRRIVAQGTRRGDTIVEVGVERGPEFPGGLPLPPPRVEEGVQYTTTDVLPLDWGNVRGHVIVG